MIDKSETKTGSSSSSKVSQINHRSDQPGDDAEYVTLA
jgi:hypothetical protein